MKFRAFLLSVILAAGVSLPTLASAQTDPAHGTQSALRS